MYTTESTIDTISLHSRIETTSPVKQNDSSTITEMRDNCYAISPRPYHPLTNNTSITRSTLQTRVSTNHSSTLTSRVIYQLSNLQRAVKM